jgi:hypothetical protein
VIEVWLAIGDDGNSEEADEYVDSVWRTEQEAQDRTAKIVAYLTRVERHELQGRGGQ